MTGLTEYGKVKFAQNIFNNAYRSKNSLIILDDIERLLEYVHLGTKFSNHMLQVLLTYLRKMPEKIGNKITIIGTTSNKEILRDLGIWECFNIKAEIPVLDCTSTKNVLSQLIHNAASSNLGSIDLSREFKIPIKSLYFIASAINQKLKSHPSMDIKSAFHDILSKVDL